MSEVLLELDSVHVNFPARKNWLGRVTEQVHALNGMDLRSIAAKRWALWGNPAVERARWRSC